MRDRTAERITPSDICVLPRSIFGGTWNLRVASLRDTKLEAIQILPSSTLRRIREKIRYVIDERTHLRAVTVCTSKHRVKGKKRDGRRRDPTQADPWRTADNWNNGTIDATGRRKLSGQGRIGNEIGSCFYLRELPDTDNDRVSCIRYLRRKTDLPVIRFN